MSLEKESLSEMMQLCVTDGNSESVVPPEEQLTVPPILTSNESAEENQAEQSSQGPALHWLVVAKNRRVNRDWELLLLRAPENARRCYKDLCTAPMVRKPGRVFPLKGKLYKGAWEYEVTSAERVFYVPDPQKRIFVYSSRGFIPHLKEWDESPEPLGSFH